MVKYLEPCQCDIGPRNLSGIETTVTVTPCVEELADYAGGGWRVCCYGCHVMTSSYATPEKAIETWRNHLAMRRAVDLAEMEGK